MLPNTNIFVGAIRPWWLNSLDGTLSYSELVLRLTDRRLYATQRDHAQATHATGDQATLLAASHASNNQKVQG